MKDYLLNIWYQFTDKVDAKIFPADLKQRSDEEYEAFIKAKLSKYNCVFNAYFFFFVPTAILAAIAFADILADWVRETNFFMLGMLLVFTVLFAFASIRKLPAQLCFLLLLILYDIGAVEGVLEYSGILSNLTGGFLISLSKIYYSVGIIVCLIQLAFSLFEHEVKLLPRRPVKHKTTLRSLDEKEADLHNDERYAALMRDFKVKEEKKDI